MTVQINARVSETTKAWLERESRTTGIKKEFLVEEALLHHLQALHELPADIIVHPRLVVSAETAEAMLTQTAEPTPALRDLMRRHGG
jgi:hypothetical protein